MRSSTSRDPVIARLREWAKAHPGIHAVLLTSSRAIPDRPVDAVSDYDVILYSTDPTHFLEDREWPRELGPVLLQMPAVGMAEEWTSPTRLVLYRDGTKIDFTLLPIGLLEAAVDRGALSEELEAGYEVVFDESGLARQLPAPSGIAYRPTPPAQAEFSAVVEEFLWETAYVARNLWREELLPAKYSLECVMRVELLRRMLEWRAACDREWAFRPGVLGRGLKRHLRPDRWTELESTFVGADVDENWDALRRMVSLFRDTALDVAARLGLEYPADLTDEVMDYVERIRGLEPRGGETGE